MIPHPQRCETCEYRILPNDVKKDYKSFKGYCSVGQKLAETEYFPIYDTDWNFTELFGCASHSTAASGREQVLEEVRTACIKDESVGVTIFHILQELRKQDVK